MSTESPDLAPMKPQVYKDERPAEYFTRFHERTRTRDPDFMYEVVRLVLTPILLLFFRTRCIDSHKIPAEGPVIVAPKKSRWLRIVGPCHAHDLTGRSFEGQINASSSAAPDPHPSCCGAAP